MYDNDVYSHSASHPEVLSSIMELIPASTSWLIEPLHLHCSAIIRFVLSQGCLFPSAFSEVMSSKVLCAFPRHLCRRRLHGSFRRPHLSTPPISQRCFSKTQPRPLMETSGFTESQLLVREAISKICANYPDVCTYHSAPSQPK